MIVAGSDASDHPDAFLAAGADAVLIGEGIAALVELIERLDLDPDIATAQWTSGIAGVATLVDGQTQLMRLGAQPPDPRLTGRPAWDLVDIERYRTMWNERHGYFSLMAASRGCPFRYNWCAKPIWGNHYKQRGPQDIAAEMTYLEHTFRPDHIWLADDKELSIVHSQEVGSHMLFLGLIASDENLAKGTQLHHRAGFHQAYRRRRGTPFAEM